MRKPVKFGLTAIALAAFHFGVAFVVALFIWLGSWGAGPQGGEVSLSPEEREQRDRMKPYEEAFTSFLQATDRVLAFPLSRTGSRDFQSPTSACLNSGLWGVALATSVLLLRKSRKRKAQPPHGEATSKSAAEGASSEASQA